MIGDTRVWSVCPLGFESELDLLEIRFAEQDSVVDVFVVSEASTTYNGDEKRWLLDLSDDRWAPWRSKVRLVRVDDEPDWNVDPFQGFGVRKQWQRENHQRRALGREMHDVNTRDVVVVSDLDEILRPATFTRYVERDDTQVVHPEIPMHRHFLNLRWSDRMGISIARLMRGSEVIDRDGDVEACRRTPAQQQWRVPYWNVYAEAGFDLAQNGWHFSWMGGVEAVERKLRLAAHPEELSSSNGTRRGVKRHLANGLDLQGVDGRHLYWVPDTQLPEHARGERFSHLRCRANRATAVRQAEHITSSYYWRG